MSSETNNNYWSMTEGVFNCLIDDTRTIAFAKAIKKTVSPGDVVVDMGTGSGVLAMCAARAGARKVYAVEIDPNNIRTLEATFSANNLQNIITVVPGDILTVSLPEKVDVIIGEMIATGLIEELQIPAMNHMHQFAKENVKVLLNKYDTFIDLVDNNNKYYDLVFDVIRYEYPDEKSLKSRPATHKKHIVSYDFSKPIDIAPVDKTVEYTVIKNGRVNGVRISGQTTFFDKSTLNSTFAYDYPIILPVTELIARKGDTFKLTISYTPSKGIGQLDYSLTKV